MNLLFLIFIIFPMMSFSLFGTALGHGLGGELLPPVKIGDRNAAVSVDMVPSVFDPNDDEKRIVVRFFDVDTDAVIEHVTYLIEFNIDNQHLFKYKFHDDFGNLILKIKSTDSEKIQVYGKESSTLGWMKDDVAPVTLEGPIFTSGGLYEFTIQILTLDSDTNVLEQPIVFNGAISIAEKTSHPVVGSDGSSYNIGVTSYYDTIYDFEYLSAERRVSFLMPFNWDEKNIEQTSIVHEELHIPTTFPELFATDYYVTVNDVPLPDASIQIDDYSDDKGRIVHVIIPPQQLFAIRNNTDRQLQDMDFSIKPAKKITMPLSIYANAQYQIDLWWAPPTINANKETTFYVDLKELYTIKKEQKPITFDFVLMQDDTEFFRKTIQSQLNAAPKSTPIEYKFSKENEGLITASIQNIGGNKFAKNHFNLVVKSEEISSKTFPMQLESKSSLDGSTAGSYYVDLTWFPTDLKIYEDSEFVITIYNKKSGLPVSEAEYDFVLLDNENKEIYRTAGFAEAGGSFENYRFKETDMGNIVIRIENIDGSSEFVELTTVVTPEFPFNVLLILSSSLFVIIIITKMRKPYSALLYR